MDREHKRREQNGEGRSTTPEFIVVEGELYEEDIPQEEVGPEQGFAQGFSQMDEIQIPFRFRLFCVFLGMLSLIWAIGALICFFISILLSILFPFARERALNFWIYFKRALVIALGLILSFFAPHLGFGIVLFYFMVSNHASQGPIERLMRANLKDYFH